MLHVASSSEPALCASSRRRALLRTLRGALRRPAAENVPAPGLAPRLQVEAAGRSRSAAILSTDQGSSSCCRHLIRAALQHDDTKYQGRKTAPTQL